MKLTDRLRRKFGSLHWQATNYLQTAILRRIDLENTLSSGIILHVKSPTDWAIYNEIFVEGSYDLALQETFSRAAAGETVRILDLGANMGFFCLRALHLHFLQNAGCQVEIICVEGSPENFRELQSRVRPYASQVRLVHGLVGERGGEGIIRQSPSHGMTSVVNVHVSNKQRRVNYVDLLELTRGWDCIHLLKCDIEGSEEVMLKNYPDLFRKVRRVVLELHDQLVDVPECQRRLRDAGLTCRRVLADHPFCSVEYLTVP